MVDLTYRPPRAEDLEDMHAIMSHWSVVRQLGGWPWPANRAFTATRCKPYDGKGFVWAICHDDRLVGTVAATNGVVGYCLHPDLHRRGIVTAATQKAVTHAFATTDLPHLEAAAWHDNPGSNGVLAKCGFKHWQTRYEQSRARRLPVITHYYRLPRQHWQSLEKSAAID